MNKETVKMFTNRIAKLNNRIRELKELLKSIDARTQAKLDKDQAWNLLHSIHLDIQDALRRE